MRQPSVILDAASKKEDLRVDVAQIKNNLKEIDRRRKEEIAEHKKNMSALDKEEALERKALIKAETKLLQAAK